MSRWSCLVLAGARAAYWLCVWIRMRYHHEHVRALFEKGMAPDGFPRDHRIEMLQFFGRNLLIFRIMFHCVYNCRYARCVLRYGNEWPTIQRATAAEPSCPMAWLLQTDFFIAVEVPCVMMPG